MVTYWVGREKYGEDAGCFSIFSTYLNREDVKKMPYTEFIGPFDSFWNAWDVEKAAEIPEGRAK